MQSWPPVRRVAELGSLGGTTQQHYRTQMKTKTTTLYALMLMNISFAASAGNLTGPFVPGSGLYTVIPDGGFESGSTAGYIEQRTDLGVWRATNDFAYAGNYSLKATVITTGTQIGYATRRTVSVTPGQTYVLSAYFFTMRTSNGPYMDLNDAPFEPTVFSYPGVPQWQFSWAEFTVPPGVTEIPIRFVHDGIFTAGDVAYVDEVALTPASEFRPPDRELRLSIVCSEVRVCWNSQTNKMYQVQYRSALTTNAWVDLGPPIQGSATNSCISDPVVSPQRFYQVTTLP